jgi:hypothetical protein
VKRSANPLGVMPANWFRAASPHGQIEGNAKRDMRIAKSVFYIPSSSR